MSSPQAGPLMSGEELEPVAPRVEHVEASLATGNLGRIRPLDSPAVSFESAASSSSAPIESATESRMSLGRGSEAHINPDVELLCSQAEPAPAARRQQRRLLDLVEPEQSPVERPRLSLAPGRSRYLDMIETGQGHRPS